MISINGTEVNGQSAYMISFYHCNFLITSGINQKSLSFFSTNKQQNLGKIEIRIDLSHLHTVQNLEKANYLLISRYKDILIAPYLLRRNSKIKIILSKLSFQLGKIHLQSFYNLIKSLDRKQTNNKQLGSYFQQSEVKDIYEQQFNIKLDLMPTIYSLNEIKQVLSRCIQINFGQELNIQAGIMVKGISSGETMGSTNWILSSLITKQSLLWLNYLSQSPLKSIKNSGQFQITTPITHIFINSTLFDQIISQHIPKELSQQLFQSTIKKIEQNLQLYKVCSIVEENQLNFLDYLADLNWNLNGKFRQIFIDHERMNHMINYCNSYVQYLAEGYHNRIYIDPPEYPFQNFYVLQQKLTLWTGSLQEIAEKQKLPMKELLARSKPYVHIIPLYKAYLFDYLDQKHLLNPLKAKIKIQDAMFMLKRFNTQNISFFSKSVKELQVPWKRMEFNKTHKIGKAQERFLFVKSFGDCMLSRFQTINGQIFSSPVNAEYIKINKNWKQQLLLALSQRGIFSMIGYLNSKQQCLQIGQSTKIWMKNHQLHIQGDEIELLKIIQDSLGSISKKLKFN